MSRIVVGVDGSEGSVAALQWAVEEARLRGAAVEAVQAFHVPYEGGATVVPLNLDPEEFRKAAEASLTKTIGQVAHDGVELTHQAVEGPASTVLVEAGRGSALLVVGARGHGGLTGMLIGSVSRQVSEHASVPVVVVPRPKP